MIDVRPRRSTCRRIVDIEWPRPRCTPCAARSSGHRQLAMPPPRHAWSTRVRDYEIEIMELPPNHASFTRTKEYYIIHAAMCIFQFILEKSLEARYDLD